MVLKKKNLSRIIEVQALPHEPGQWAVGSRSNWHESYEPREITTICNYKLEPCNRIFFLK